MKITFWGVRGTLPCTSASHSEFGGNTSCVEVECDGQSFIFDAGSGLRHCGESLAQRGQMQATLLLSHFHHDHLMGLPFFSPAYQEMFSLKICGVPGSRAGIKKVLEGYLADPYFPVPLQKLMPSVEFQNMLYGCEYRFNRVRLRTIRLNHPGGATGYRLEYAGRSFCYITDVEHKIGVQDVGLVNFLRGADVLVYDSTYTDSEFPAHVGWGHSTWQEAVRLGLMAGVEHTVLFHHDPSHDDVFLRNIESELAGCAARVSVARDGLRMSL